MAAPTSVRVESGSVDTATLYWVGGAAEIGVYVSTDGSSYALIPGAVSPEYTVDTGVLTYTATELVPGTFYYFKLSDDRGSTFSSVVTVKTQSCRVATGAASELHLPRAGEAVEPADFDSLAQSVEEYTRREIAAPTPCEVCTTSGALVLDCTQGCGDFTVNVTEDINSISLVNCSQDGIIDFIVPAGVTRGICGWPAGFGFSGDECFQAPISGGTTGRTVTAAYGGNGSGGGNRTRTNPTSSRGYGGAGGGAGGLGATCTCTAGPLGQLTIKCCNDNCSLKCGTTRSLMLKACGGKTPYSWSKTGSITLQVGDNGTPGATATGTTVIVKPPTNSGSAVAGEAYRSVVCACSSVVSNVYIYQSFKCDDTAFAMPNCTEASAAGAMVCNNGNITSCCILTLACNGDGSGGVCTCGKHTSGISPCNRCSNAPPAGQLCDVRTGPMISGGCAPCGLQNGSTVTVTDALGTSVSIVVRN